MKEITIDYAKFEELMEAQAKLELIEKLARTDDSKYGYSCNTSLAIDLVLDIQRERNEG